MIMLYVDWGLTLSLVGMFSADKDSNSGLICDVKDGQLTNFYQHSFEITNVRVN